MVHMFYLIILRPINNMMHIKKKKKTCSSELKSYLLAMSEKLMPQFHYCRNPSSNKTYKDITKKKHYSLTKSNIMLNFRNRFHKITFL